MAAVTICTQVYNAAAYLPQCIESVLGQTCQDFEYFLVDNGCTDGSEALLRQYAAADSRIRLTRFAENQIAPRGMRLACQYGTGTYLTCLDADDWWEPDYLERMIAFAERERLDAACTGSIMHLPDGTQRARCIEEPLILSRASFPEAFPWYHAFFRTTWNKLIRMECVRAVELAELPRLVYGSDTAYCFQILRHAGRIGIDSSKLHHYRIHPQSVSYQYNAGRFDADVYLYNDAAGFLAAFGPVSARNRQFLQIVYANAVSDTLRTIRGASLTAAEKLREYGVIARHPLTRAVYQECTDTCVRSSRNLLLEAALTSGGVLDGQPEGGLREVLDLLAPHCAPVVTAQNIPLILQDAALLEGLRSDMPEAMLRRLLELAGEGRYIKKYDLTGMVRALSADRPLLCRAGSGTFLRWYGWLYLRVWRGELPQALDEMAGLLLDGQVERGRETFLELFISIAAALEQAPAFVYGEIQLAQLLLKQKRWSECQAHVAGLEEMGLGGHEEVAALRRQLERSTPGSV